MKRMYSISGWVGMVGIQFATIPTIIKILSGALTQIPPFDMVFLMWSGLILLLIRAIGDKDNLYIVANSCGLACQSILLWLIIDKY